MEKIPNDNRYQLQIYYKQDNLLGSPIDHSRAFADEALQLLETERNYQSITLVQGLALLWVYEGNCGNKSRAVDLLNELYHVHECLGLSRTTIPTGTRMAEPAAQRKWHAISCICWGFYSLLTYVSCSRSWLPNMTNSSQGNFRWPLRKHLALASPE